MQKHPNPLMDAKLSVTGSMSSQFQRLVDCMNIQRLLNDEQKRSPKAKYQKNQE